MDKYNSINRDDDFICELVDEVDFFVTKLIEDDSQEMRRAFCRAVFQFVDGVASELKNNIAYYESPQTIGNDFYLSLFDKVMINKNGGKIIITRRKGFAKNIELSFELFGVVTGVELDLKENLSEWKRFKNCISIRNRVVHPKTKSDLIVSNGDMKEMLKMYLWLEDEIINAYYESAMSFLRQAQSMGLCYSALGKQKDVETE